VKRLVLVVALLAIAACGDASGVADTGATTTTTAAQASESITTTSTATTTTTAAPAIVEFGTVVADGEPLPVLGSGEDPALGLVAPEIVGSDFAGREVRIEHDGRAKAIVFLAHWCPHCQDELPELRDWLAESGGPGGVDVVAVATGTNPARPNFPPSEWFADEDWSAPVIVDDEDLTALRVFGGPAFPFWTFLADDGTVALRVAGRIDLPALESILSQLVDL
jgi:thiol-disulfide isomerase/thioredoxin